ncbi:ThuA domain-containing protein [Jeotgalibacillus sp. ET6]|uniref:ThuA domain-containing protein n=1 Tax=Jeotgalibacillus sp. ET6 TaxID=3037260 RepID=UPI0024186E51|nr:ThuA domain-containing protein [Jeotgalibacillus sp. ET6]MDG5471516.1 ThuA domain-containing protein [Jeotgalibacillus sp. ET6]
MMKKMLAILGDYYHPADRAKASLELAIEQMKEQVNVTYGEVQDLEKTLNAEWDCVILYAENRLNPEDEQVETWMSAASEEAIASYVKQGGSWLAWHSGLSSYNEWSTYTNMVKGFFDYHPEKHQMVRYSIEGDSVFSPLDSFSLVDEHYFVSCDAEDQDIFMRSSSVDGESIAGWSHDYGSGKVVCLTPAHNEEGLKDPSFTRLLATALDRCTGAILNH